MCVGKSYDVCRFCSKYDRVLSSFVLTIDGKSISTFVCQDCSEKIKGNQQINVCMYCGNLFLTEEVNNSVLLIPRCGICEREGQCLKNGRESQL